MAKAIIYLRTSTKDQHPELQEKDCIEFCSKIGLEVIDMIPEKGSAYKLEKVRPRWESVLERAKKEKLDIVVWKYDRAFRNRKEFFSFMKVMFEVYKTKVYSATEPSILSFWNILGKEYTENPVMNEFIKGIFGTIWDLMIQLAGEEAEEESKKKSDRVKLAVRKEDDKGNKIPTRSYKGNKWGRKELKLREEILRLREEGKTIREICNEVSYWDSKNNKKFVSVGYVHKILSKSNSQIKSSEEVSLTTQ